MRKTTVPAPMKRPPQKAARKVPPVKGKTRRGAPGAIGAPVTTSGTIETSIPVVIGTTAYAVSQRAAQLLRQLIAIAQEEPLRTRATSIVAVEDQAGRPKVPRADRELRRLEASMLGRSMEQRLKLLRGALPVDKVCEILGIKSRQTIHNRVKRGEMLAISDGNRVLLPRWQFDPSQPGGVLEGLPKVLHVMQISPIAAANWFVLPNAHLGGKTPLAMMKQGKLEQVVDEARGLGAH